jgi:hypothetical protein
MEGRGGGEAQGVALPLKLIDLRVARWFWRALDWKMLIHFMSIWNALLTFGIFYDLWNMFAWYIFSGFVIG